ncbi:alpha/beta hydrolase [Plebeiibacterium sediminum]|uniref:Lysophospholipase n=1 Tax=Plebeiibacterium sediminum TaxID=2992112 RepID=A0AAE3SFK0_9BACT|nr:alpha/beta hydrolase [Plebeiobacterium sediminum]MCW3787172.1 lysophospholipase [Plebeiobacterium sediminum]
MKCCDHSPFYTYSKDKTLIHGMYWLPSGNIKAVICLVHGLGGHIARFADFAHEFCKNKIGVIGVDLRGHGKSQGKRGDVKTLNEFYEDIKSSLKYLEQIVPENTPLYIYGNSMGGPVALKFAMENTDIFHGVILAAPWFTLYKQPEGIKLSVLRMISMIFPCATFSSGIKSGEFRSDPKKQQEAKSDVLAHKYISARLFSFIHDLGLDLVLNKANDFNLPTIIFHGNIDRVTDYKSSLKYKENNTENVEFVLLPNTKHEIHVEPERNNVLNKIVSWIESNEKYNHKNSQKLKEACTE